MHDNSVLTPQTQRALVHRKATGSKAAELRAVAADTISRADAPAAAISSKIARAIEAVRSAGEAYSNTQAATANAWSEACRLCGTEQEQKEIEDRGRNSVPIPASLQGLPVRGPYIERMLVTYSDGRTTHDFTRSEPERVDVTDWFKLKEASGRDPKLERQFRRALEEWNNAKSAAWDSLYSAEQKTAQAAYRSAQRQQRLAQETLEKAVQSLMRIHSRNSTDIAAKFSAWAEAWGIAKADGSVATDQMDEWDNQLVLASIGADLLRNLHPVAQSPGRRLAAG